MNRLFQLIQTLKNGDKLVAEIALPLPEAANVAGALNNEAAQVGFACISSENSIGVLEISSSWGTDKNGAPLAPTELKKSFYDEESFSMRNLGANPGLMNLKTMMEWISDPKIDPNDPRNVVITKMKNLLKELSSNDKDLKDQNVFRLGLPSWLHDMTLSVEPGVSANTLKRFEVLIKRSKGELKLSQPVPLNFTTHMAEITSSETNTIRDETEQNTVRKWSERNNITELKDSDESINMGFLKRIRDLQLIRKSALEIPQHVDQYVVEARLPPAVITDFDLFGIFRPSRPLNPQRLNRKMFLTTDADHCRLMIQILQGYNLPTRLNTSQSRIDDTTLRPFCEFTFQRRKFHTNTVMGNNPLFNETVAVPIIAKNGDFKADALMETDLATETLYINIYDEIIVDLIQDDKEREREIYYRRDKVWIGSLEIPFCSIWERSRVDGKFPIAVPISLLGYTSENPNQYPSIHIFLTLDPPLSQPRILDLKFKSNEPAELISKATSFQAAHNRIGTDSCMVLTHDLEGKITLVCRFIRPQNPPSGLDTIQLVTRFVAMIPHLPSRTVFKVKCHLWATSNQILSVGAADSIEHSILLCNYLLHLGYNAYVATGSSLIQGSFSFVLIPIENQFTNNYYSPRKTGFNINNFLGMQDANISPMYNCIDPVSGKIYNQMEVRAHGIEITACFNDKNVKLCNLALLQHAAVEKV